MSKNNKPTAQAAEKKVETIVETTVNNAGIETPVEGTESGEDETPKEYVKPTRPSWLKDGDTVLVKAKASPKGEAGIEYQAEVLTDSGVKAVVENNLALVTSLLNNQVKAHNLAGYARKFGTGEYAFDWTKKPGERGAKAAKEAAQIAADRTAFAGLFEGTGMGEEIIETKWQAYLLARKI